MKAEIIPGILTHNLEEYVNRLELVEQSSSTWAHIDFMDGQFVGNISVMPHEIMGIPTKLKLEAHMMTYRPERYFSDLTVAGINRILLHREAYTSFQECADALKQAGDYFTEVGLVINPETSVEDYRSLPIASLQCMGVHPGVSGQTLIDPAYDIIKAVKAQQLGAVIAVDGGVNEDNIKELQKAGASRFVISSHIFITNATISQNVQYFSQLVSGGA